MINRGNLNLILQNRGSLVVRPNDHVATGGEGSVYQAHDTAIKVYTEPDKKVVWNDVEGKIKFFKKNPHPYVIAPLGTASLKKNNKVVGYYMDFVKGEPISRVFTNSYQLRNNFKYDDIITLVERMRQIVSFAHRNNALLIDANELGYFVVRNSSNEVEPRIIDTDSWVLDNKFPPVCPTMPSIRDWHIKGWKRETDWFAWGIVTFQVFTGIHPFKGTLAGYKRNELEKRMKKNASVFSSGVRLNNAVRDFSTIPSSLLDWYRETFQQGKRSNPPEVTHPSQIPIAERVLHVKASGSDYLKFTKMLSKKGNRVINSFFCGVVLLDSGELVDISSQKTITTTKDRGCKVVASENGWVLGEKMNNNFQYKYINKVSLEIRSIRCDFKPDKVLTYENRIFIVALDKLIELELLMAKECLLSHINQWGILSKSTKWFNGVGVQDALGATYLVIPYGSKQCAVVRVPELDGLKPITAKSGYRFVVVIGIDSNGEYKKIELTFDSDYGIYKAWSGITDSSDLNMAILPNGVCATIIEDGELVIFVPLSGKVKKIKDKMIDTSMELSNWGLKVLVTEGENVWRAQVK